MIRLTATQLVTALAAVGFLFIQVVVLEIRSGSNARAKIQERLASLEARDAGQDARMAGFEKRISTMGQYVLDRLESPRDYSEDSPPPPEL